MLTAQAIRDRFIKLLAEVAKQKTLEDIARSVKTTAPYLSKVKTAPNPELPSILIARFCKAYGYSPHYILLGQGDKRTTPEPAESKDIYYLRIIDKLTSQLSSK